MRIAWVLGWAVSPEWFSALALAVLPNDDHVCFPAVPGWLERVTAAGPWDVIGAHSLGTLLVQQDAERVGRLTASVVLLAPIAAFPCEENRGGRVARTQIKYLARWLRVDRAAALEDFYQRAGLSGCGAADVATEDLSWGLERLAVDRVSSPLPKGWRAYVGSEDALLDAEALRTVYPEIVCVTGARHHPAALLRAWTEGAA